MKNKSICITALFLTMISLTISIHAEFTFLDQRYDVEKILAMMNLYILIGIISVAAIIKYLNKK